MKKQDIVDYGSVKFHQIIPQDNPAYLDQQCVMIVGSSSCKGKFKVLAIVPDPEESVHEVAEFFRHDHAKIFAEQNEIWFTDYIQKLPTDVDDIQTENNTSIVIPITNDHIVFGVSKTDFTETLNEYKASMFYMIGCDGFTYSNTISDEFKHCITYVGGFVDSFYFIKSEIMKLSDLDFKRFINRLDYCRSKFSQSTTNSETEK